MRSWLQDEVDVCSVLDQAFNLSDTLVDECECKTAASVVTCQMDVLIWLILKQIFQEISGNSIASVVRIGTWFRFVRSWYESI